MYLYFKQDGKDVHLLLTWIPYIPYNKILSRAKRVHFDEGVIHFICYDLCDIQHVKFSRKKDKLSLQTIWFNVCLTLTPTIKCHTS